MLPRRSFAQAVRAAVSSRTEISKQPEGKLRVSSLASLGNQIHEALALDPRVTILGHIQRGGTPTARDRTMATRMGYAAVEALAEGKTNRVICAQHGTMIDVDIEEGLRMKKGLNLQQTKVLDAMTGL